MTAKGVFKSVEQSKEALGGSVIRVTKLNEKVNVARRRGCASCNRTKSVKALDVEFLASGFRDAFNVLNSHGVTILR